jgi:tRNA(Ile)-lysidine synthase
MAPARAEAAALVLRPLLGAAPARLDAVVGAAGLQPVRDPTNADPRFARTELRRALADPAGTGLAVSALADAASAFGLRRTEATAPLASRLAAAARLHPEGHAAVDLRALGEDGLADAALAALLRAVGGAERPPPVAAVRRLRRQRGGGTIAGAWLRQGGAPPFAGFCASRARCGRRFRRGAAPSGTGGSAWWGRARRIASSAPSGRLRRRAEGRARAARDGARDISRRLARRRAGGSARAALS